MGPQGGMGVLARVLDTCATLGILDPAQFFALPADVQELWIAHTGNVFSGAYLGKPKNGTGGAAIDSADAERKFRAAKRRKAAE